MERMRSGRLAFVLGVAVAILLGTALRLHTREQADAGPRVHPLDSDSAYHLRRARFAAAHFPRTILFDPLMNFPAGGVAIWPPLFDLALALPARLSHGAAAPADAIERGAAWVPVAFAAGAIALAGLLARRVYGPAAGVAAALFLAVCPGHILWSQYAHTDQHTAESFCGLLALVLFLRSREEPASPGNAAREASAGAALALAVLTWQGAICWGAVFALALVLETGLAGRSTLRAAAWTLGLPAAVTAAATAAWLGWFSPPLTYVSFGYFQPLFLAALLGGTAAIGLAVRASRRQLAPRELSTGLALVALAAAATLPFARSLFAGLVNGVGYVAGTTREIAGANGYVSYPKDWLKGIFETRPLFADGPMLAVKQLSLGFFLAPVAVAAWAVRARRGLRPGVHAALAVWGTVTLFLAISQRLNVYYAAPLAALALIETVRTVAPRIRRPVLATVFGIALALPMGPGLKEELATVFSPGSDLFATLGRMRAELPHPVGAYDAGLLGPPPFPAALSLASSVMAPWSLGHFLLYEAEEPVVANNFGYGFLDSVRFFLAESEEEALAIARRHRARWIVATDLVPRLNEYASYIGKPPYLSAGPDGLVPTAAYFRTMQSRLYDFGGKGSEPTGASIRPLSKIRLLFHSQSAIRRGGRWIPRWSVFEINDP
ncbi:MAG TPA: STT3 domain-containing protein [Thermoanaerobaculia bacterium]|jgi:asparagine N-glycosylation enzyme membrane subunit Stt3|nr:STT3 domain-containing protein [Thermoanaerobaculia bacterium]